MFLERELKSTLRTKNVGDTDSLHGKMDGVPYEIFCMKEPNYIIKIMSTYDGLIVKNGQRESKREYEKDGEMVKKHFNIVSHSLTILTSAIV